LKFRNLKKREREERLENLMETQDVRIEERLMKDRRKNKHFESRERPIKVMAQKNKW
jgi:hypothetical protein